MLPRSPPPCCYAICAAVAAITQRHADAAADIYAADATAMMFFHTSNSLRRVYMLPFISPIFRRYAVTLFDVYAAAMLMLLLPPCRYLMLDYFRHAVCHMMKSVAAFAMLLLP